jgi:NAD(P)-dependent dehydrogenase (short-subunit alcohol dehydrogenase family)
MLALAGKGAIVAGARRVGRAVVLRLAREGVHQAIVYRRSRREAEVLAREASEAGAPAAALQCDLNDEDAVRRLIEEAEKVVGSLSFAVNLASDFERTPFKDLDGEAWDRGMAQARGAYLLAVHASRRMMGNAGPTRGHLVLFSDSSAMHTPYWDYVPYLTAKAAIAFMTRAFAVELAPHGILVNAIAPGPTLRPADLDAALWRDQVLAGTPLKRESSPEDIAEMVTALLKSETITGEVIPIDAGVHLAGHGPAGEPA